MYVTRVYKFYCNFTYSYATDTYVTSLMVHLCIYAISVTLLLLLYVFLRNVYVSFVSKVFLCYAYVTILIVT